MTGDRSALGRSAKPHSPGDVRLSLDLFIHLFCFVSLLLIGADRWGIELIGVNFRVDQLFLCIFALLLVVKKAYRFTFNGWIAAFLFLSLISTLFAVSIMRGILFYCSIVYNVLFLFYALASYVKCYGFGMFIRIFRMTMKVQFFILLFQFALKLVTGYEFSFLPSYGEYMGIYRFQIWFYEPSYLATYLVLWFSFSLMRFLLRGCREYLVDLLMCLAMFLMSTSTSGFIGIALTVVVVYCMWLARGPFGDLPRASHRLCVDVRRLSRKTVRFFPQRGVGRQDRRLEGDVEGLSRKSFLRGRPGQLRALSRAGGGLCADERFF